MLANCTALRKENEERRRQAEDMTKLLDLLATGSVVTEEKQHLQELREMVNRLSPHRTPTIALKDTVIREEPTDSVSCRMMPTSLHDSHYCGACGTPSILHNMFVCHICAVCVDYAFCIECLSMCSTISGC